MTAIAMRTGASARAVLEGIWRDAGGAPEAPGHARFEGDIPLLPSVFQVGLVASVATAAAGLAAAELWRQRTGQAQAVTIRMRHAEVAYRSERYLRVKGEWPGHRDPVWGYYRTADGRWLQLHTGFPHHLEGALRLLGCAGERPAVQRAIAGWCGQALGVAHAGATAVDQDAPGPLPCQALDHTSGYLAACGVMIALARRATEGGSWHVGLSLAQCAEWLQRLGRIDALDRPDPGLDDVRDLLEETDTPFGPMTGVRPVARLSETPASWARPAVPLGTHAPEWP
jgi:crotonobetainyl-CoA:carnitine CoA-transferase CaiB-like acyl-CoA transferase